MESLSKNILTVEARPKFFNSIASGIFKFKRYPTANELRHVAEQITRKYPFLKTSSGTGYVSLTLFFHCLASLTGNS